ncbi:MAG: bacteriorhodopsin [Massilia sp.]|nr:bacteriorhodopsin [Massilia sp.]
MDAISVGQFELVYNAFSFAIAVMGAATIFFFLGRSQVAAPYKTAITVTGLVTLIAAYHYVRIFASWEASYTVLAGQVSATGVKFNDAYRYVDWLLTVPLLLIELILVMRLSAAETVAKGTKLGLLAALMVVLGYPGEISALPGTRWLWWALAMVPFLIIVFDLFVGLKKSIASQPASVRGLVSAARWLTVGSWCFYPVVFVFPMIGFTGSAATTAVQVGYTVADIVAKAVFGVLVYMIAVRKSAADVVSAVTAPGPKLGVDAHA